MTFVNKNGFIDFLSMKLHFECEKKITYVKKFMYFTEGVFRTVEIQGVNYEERQKNI